MLHIHRNRIFLFLFVICCFTGINAVYGDRSKKWSAEDRQEYASHFITPSNPLGFSEYDQTLTILYPTAQDAEKSRVLIAPMPDLQKIAFSTRWDDVNKNHLRMAKLLQKHQMNGTFFLTRPSSDYYDDVAEKILQSGSAIGSHTLNHLSMPTLLPNIMFYQNMLNRIELESNLDTTVVSYVLPGCALYTSIEHETPKLVGDMIQRSGFLAVPEFWNNADSLYGLPPNTCFPTNLFSADDRHPTEEKFEKGLERQLARAAQTPSVPHITFGLHTWQDEAGFQTLDKLYGKYSKKTDWWFCTQNDYAAYRYQLHHTKMLPTEKQEGKVTLRLRRITPHHLGSEIPLSVQIFPLPQSVLLNGKTIQRTTEGVYKLPHSPDRKIPKTIDWVRNENNLPLSDEYSESRKIPGLFAGIHWDESSQKFHAYLLNRTRFRIRNLNKTIYFPAFLKKSPVFMQTWELLPGGKDSFVFKPAVFDYHPAEERKDGNLFFAVQFDFMLDKRPVRLYATTLAKRPFISKAYPRDTAVFLGPYEDHAISEQQKQALSDPRKSLFHPGVTKNLSWFPTKQIPDNRFFVIAPPEEKEWRTEAAKRPQGNRLIAFDFEADSQGGYQLFCSPKKTEAVYLNGKKLGKITNPLLLPTQTGINRIVVAQKPRNIYEFISLSVSKTIPSEPARCIRPDLPKQ